MREYCEFRVLEKYARLLFEPGEGKRLGDSVRKVVLSIDDPRFSEVGRLQADLRITRGYPFFTGWHFRRQYSSEELESAKLFHLSITAVFEPPGETCGTVYDESAKCQYCGAGRKQSTDLLLDLRKAPKKKDIARTIADEWIVSQRLAELLVDAKITGLQLRPILQKPRHEDEPLDLKKVPSGQKLLQLAGAENIGIETWQFLVWLNRPDHRQLLGKAIEEHAHLLQKRRVFASRPIPVWYQLVVTSMPIQVVRPTQFGINPFDYDNDGRFHCPMGHVKGLNLLSELFVSSADWDGADVACTKELVGRRQGLLVPRPLLLISPRLYRLLKDCDRGGAEFEIAHLVSASEKLTSTILL